MGSESMLQEILWDTKIGWWKVDMARRVLLLSDYLCKTIGTEESEIGYDRFQTVFCSRSESRSGLRSKA